MPLPFSHFTTAEHSSDFRAFRELIKSKGKTLDSTAEDKLFLASRGIYTRNGRTDFWPLKIDYQLGAGVECYSFHGKVGTLVNGPTWETDGIRFSAISKYIETNAYPVSSSFPMWIAWAGSIDAHVNYGVVIDINGSSGYDIFTAHCPTSGILSSAIRTSNAGAFSLSNFNIPVPVGSPFFFAEGYGNGVHRMRAGTEARSRSIVSSVTIGQRMRINVRADNGSQGGITTAAFALISFTPPSDALFQDIQTIYNSTLGA